MEYLTSIGPGPGFFPLWLGLILTGLSGAWLLGALRRSRPETQRRFFPEWRGARRILLIMAAIIGVGLAMEVAGFQLAMFAFVAFVLTALDGGKRIGVVATNPPAGPAAQAQLRAGAGARGLEIEVVQSLAAGAFAIGNTGDAATHDRMVVEAAERIAGAVDVLCLAQVSMALARAAVQARVPVPVLTAPATGVARLKALLEG
jgi:hypothetical protein